MHRPPDPSDRTGTEQPGWQGILAGYALIGAALASLWSMSYPAAAASILAAAAVVRLGAPRVAAAVRCLRVCREFTVDLGGRLRITVTRPPVDDGAA
ncbi:hypothetical protein [Halobaculum gomorrense]|uniref:Uncharacterized protein n=1 Tax=Halobaculum gomorrense TaxID=43928 RepID=A0A1M5T1U4_9EURY|nr:hypothetical protein [Halobaculum gomorrense]SHH44638.1 hypothetical protein SAMN05443636_2605 [Halobaculum gomorrense]